MPRYEAVCDCCMETQHLWAAELEIRDCPVCGVGKLLGPFPLTSRFQRPSDWEFVYFRREETAKTRD